MLIRSRQRSYVSSSARFAATGVVALFFTCILLRTTEAFAKDDALAEVDGEAITTQEVEKSIGAPLSKLQEQIYTLKRRTLDALIAYKLLGKEAEKRGMSPQALLEAETRNVEAVTEQESKPSTGSRKGS